MVRIVILSFLLSACVVASNDTPKLGKQVEAPYGWTNTYCPSHKNEIGCKNFYD